MADVNVTARSLTPPMGTKKGEDSQGNEGIPAVIIRGAPVHRSERGLSDLIRSPESDMFR